MREDVSRYACRRTKNPVGRLRGPLASGCSTLPDSQVGWIQVMTRTSPYETCRVRRGDDLFRYATMEQPRLARPQGCCDS
jgi:hypothetical protein